MGWGVKAFLKKLSVEDENYKWRVKPCLLGTQGPRTPEPGDRCFLSTEELEHEMNKWKRDGVLPWEEWETYK